MTEHPTAPSLLLLPDGGYIAYHAHGLDMGLGTASQAVGVLFCGGFHSAMTGSKASFLDQHCRNHGLPFLRFDYRGHGQSSGDAADFTLSGGIADACSLLDQWPNQRWVIIGSSMGGWIASHLALLRPSQCVGLLLLAPAWDFPTALLWPNLPQAARDSLAGGATFALPSAYGDGPYLLRQQLFDDSLNWQLLAGAPRPFPCPISILHGSADDVIPLAHVERICRQIATPQPQFTLVEGGDHRLSTPADLALLASLLNDLLNGPLNGLQQATHQSPPDNLASAVAPPAPA